MWVYSREAYSDMGNWTKICGMLGNLPFSIESIVLTIKSALSSLLANFIFPTLRIPDRTWKQSAISCCEKISEIHKTVH